MKKFIAIAIFVLCCVFSVFPQNTRKFSLEMAQASVNKQNNAYEITNSELYFPSGFSNTIYTICFSPSGKYVAVASNSEVKIFNIENKKEIKAFYGCSPVWSPNERYIVVNDDKGNIIVYDVYNEELFYSKSIGNYSVCKGWTENNVIIIINNNSIKLFDFIKQKEIRTLNYTATNASLEPMRKSIAIWTDNASQGKLILLDAQTFNEINSFLLNKISGVSWNKDNNQLLVYSSLEEYVKLIDIHNNSVTTLLTDKDIEKKFSFSTGIGKCSWSSNNSQFAVSLKSNGIGIFDINSKSFSQIFPPIERYESYSVIDWQPYGDYIASDGKFGNFYLFNAKNKNTQIKFERTKSEIKSLDWAKTENHIITSGGGNTELFQMCIQI